MFFEDDKAAETLCLRVDIQILEGHFECTML